MAGRPPKSTEQHKRDGTYQATRHKNRVELPVSNKVPDPPAHLNKAQGEVWRRMCQLLIDANRLSDQFLPAIELYCECWKTYKDAVADVDINGLTFETDSGQVKVNPAVNIEKEMRAQMIRIIEQFGFTPRSNMTFKDPPKADEEDPFMAILKTSIALERPDA